MKKIINISLVITLFSSCSMTKNVKTPVLEGQKWIFSREISPGIGSGNSWSFLPNGRFTEIDWYSGGAYWTHHYSGKYFYDEDNKTVFIKYDKDKAPHLKNILKKQLSLKFTENDTLLTITNGWKKPKEISFNAKQSLKIQNTVFKIERIEP